MRTSLAALLVLAVACAHSQPASAPANASPATRDRAWIERSNQNAQVLLAVQAQFQPEAAARNGMNGLDDRISDFEPGHQQRLRDALAKAQADLEQRLAAEHDPLVAQDLQILIDAAKRQIKGSELREKLEVPYYNVPQIIFGSMRSLLDPQVAAERRPAALVRLRKYLGMDGQTSRIQLAEAETREGMQKWLLAPARIQVENDLDTSAPVLAGINRLFEEYKIEGAEPVLAEMHKQLQAYLEFVRTEVLPKARDDFRLPPELYAFRLQQVGVDIPADELAHRAHQAFTEIQGEMQKVAAQIAQQHGWPSPDYRDVIK